jgi:hypothetical protein
MHEDANDNLGVGPTRRQREHDVPVLDALREAVVSVV